MSNTAVAQLANPFVGLRSFEETEDYLFFGRGKQIDELLKKLSDSRFLAVIGASGSGKSSLVKSGLLPSVYSGFMKVGSNWRVALMQPGENPIGYLTRELAAEGALFHKKPDSDIPLESIIEASLRRSENGLVQVYKDAHLPGNESLLVVVDQFEELFRFSKYEKENRLGQSDAMHFVQILLTAAQQATYPIYVLLTMRADFLGDCAEFRGLPEAINEGQYLVPRMTREEIREAITGPVAVSGATISQRLVTRLLNDVNNDTDQLPILQHAMMRTWQEWYDRGQHDTAIDFEDYEKIGTMSNALSIHANEAYNELSAGKEQKICELMFKALTDKAADKRGTRRPRSIADLMLLTGSTRDEICKSIETFRKPGRTFLMPPPHVELHDDSIIDISHESLMRVWDELVKWTIEEGRSGDLFMRLANSQELKEQGQRGWLKDPELAIALKWQNENKPTAKWAEGYKGDFVKTMQYLKTSHDEDILEKEKEKAETGQRLELEKKAARQKRITAMLFVMSVILAGAIIFGFRYYNLSEENKQNAATAEKNAAEANKLRKEAERLKGIAELNAQTANDSAAVAKEQRKIASDSAEAAKLQRDIAKDSAAVAQRQRKISDSIAAVAQIQRDKVAYQNLKIAANEYARLIREGATNKIKIEKDSFDYKLIAYCNHLDSLRPLIDAIKDKKAKDDYNALRERLYFNNDLYEKTYACFETITSNSKTRRTVFDKTTYAGRFKNEPDSSNADYKKVSTSCKGKIIAFTVDKSSGLIICSTTDNWIYVYKNTGNTLIEESKIPLGAQVTALDYNSEKKIIYFGLETGDIGYVEYHTNKRNQPVFENTLGSAITAIQFFSYTVAGEKRYFLLAAAKRSRVVVYELDDNMPKPDKKLSGNILPEKNLLDVVNATFTNDAKDNRRIIIKVRSKKGGETIYGWNPFTAEILAEYKRSKTIPPDFKKKYFDPANLYNKGK